MADLIEEAEAAVDLLHETHHEQHDQSQAGAKIMDFEYDTGHLIKHHGTGNEANRIDAVKNRLIDLA